MSILDDDIIDKTEIRNLGFPDINDFKINGKNEYLSYTWKNSLFFKQYRFITKIEDCCSISYFDPTNKEDLSLLSDSLSATIKKSLYGYYKLLLSVELWWKPCDPTYPRDSDYLFSKFELPIPINLFPIDDISDISLVKHNAYDSLRFFRDNPDYVETLFILFNYVNHITGFEDSDDYANYPYRYILVDCDGKPVFLPKTFESIFSFEQFIENCHRKKIKIYSPNDYINKFNLTWIY